MYIPASTSTYDAPFTATLSGSSSGSGSGTQGWSSTIGIVTAICGNILISFALNTQRYAHMRISQDREQQEEKQQKRRRRRKSQRNYGGTQQSKVAQARAEANAKAEPTRYTLQDRQSGDGDETEPLIPAVEARDVRKTSGSSSGETEGGDEEGEQEVKQKSYLRSPTWWAGITMMTLGETGNFLAYGFAPASIVSPLGVVALVSNCMIAPWLLRERFRWRDALGVVIAVGGCVTVVMSASSSNPKLDPESIWHLITRWEFLTYLGVSVVLIIILMVASNRFGEKSILIDLGLMGLFGGYTALSTKGVASLLSSSIWRVVTFPITYLLVAVLVFTAVMQIKYVNRALQRFDSTQVIPTQFVLFTLSVITGSAILYRDFERTTTEQAIKFIGGCFLTFLGVWFITSGRDRGAQDNEDTGEDEDAINLVDEEGLQREIREREDSLDRHQVASSSDLSLETTHLNEAVDLSPAKAAAIHATTAADIPSPEEPKTKQTTLHPPPIHATTSEPSVPTLETTSDNRPKTPLRRGVSSSVAETHSPSKANTPAQPSTPRYSEPHLDPNDSTSLLKRRSVAGLLPGPFTSPLSSSLSAIVADSLRRGVDNFPSNSLRRQSISLKRKLRPGAERIAPNAAPQKRHSIASGEMDLDEPDEAGAGGGENPGRMRSLSATLGDMFGSQKRRRVSSNQRDAAKQPQADENEGDGAQGS